MACANCSTGGCSTSTDGGTSGCGNGGCATGGCNKMNSFDWLSDMTMTVANRFPIVEVRFKGGRKDFYRNTNHLDLTTGDAVVLEAQGGYHLGFVSMQGELVRLQLLKKKVAPDSAEIKSIYRIATSKDLEKFTESRNKELPTLFRTRHLLDEFKLNMKMSDVEFQADCSKATFYYSADDRIDFRELIKALATEFKVRVEMRQISLRQEAGRIGGIGSCGRELCCSTWLTDFKNVTTGAARYQNLSLNPAKLSGQCGRLKCCLNYELETYLDALKGIPNIDHPLATEKGDAYLQKTDIFRKMMWFGYKGENAWHPLTIERVNFILALNKNGEKAKALTDKEEVEIELALNPQPINDDLKRMDRKMLERDRAVKKKKQELKQNKGGAKPEATNAPRNAEGNNRFGNRFDRTPKPESSIGDEAVGTSENLASNTPERANDSRPNNKFQKRNDSRPDRNNRPERNNATTSTDGAAYKEPIAKSGALPRQGFKPERNEGNNTSAEPTSTPSAIPNDILAERKNALRDRVRPEAAQTSQNQEGKENAQTPQNEERRSHFKDKKKPYQKGGNPKPDNSNKPQ